MKIVIIGGTGLIGSQVVKNLPENVDVLVGSPQTGVNTVTNRGVEEALTNAEVVVDVSNSPSFADEDVLTFFTSSTQNIVAASKKAGIKHLVILSVVGTDQLQKSGYFRAKKAQEDLIKASGIPYTIVQATQFFEFAGSIAAGSRVQNKIVLSTAFTQPIASAEIAAFVSERAIGEPANSTLEIGGPERVGMDKWIRYYLQVMKKPLDVVIDTNAPYFGSAIGQTTLVPVHAAFTGAIHYKDWISKSENQQ
ncbi:SDR family oxidoreductase [Spirosoma rigui]|uniref:SDR family oxidoreductase n=1 Tax=Spirosoma rigui TaxID=564064 RepID=UPI0009B0A17D|nr:NAD(P)H-binding protein [Spirosoma rigui]